MALSSYELTRGSLLAERERTATRTTYFDAIVVQAGLATENPDVVEVLRALDTGAVRRPVLWRNGQWFARSADSGLGAAIPFSLQQLVHSGQPGAQRVRTDAGAAIIFGIPLASGDEFYEIHSLSELEKTLQVLSLVLTLVAISTSLAGAGLGWYTTRRSLRPLASVVAAAQDIATGNLEARLDAAAEPELERLTSSFNNMVDQLSRRMERDRRFAADVSHELRSPLQTLAAAASVLTRRKEHLDGRTATAVDLIAEEVARFERLVTDLLELARSDRPAELSMVDMGELVWQVCQHRGYAPTVVHVDAADGAWPVERRRFEQVLANLLDNAERHGGGPVAIRVGRAAGARFIEVDDEGPGVLAEDRDTIFNPFVRGRAAHARGDGDGTGLGLALVAQHVAAHGGVTRVLDRPGGGARFRVELPQERP
jgi:two-component system sensor histidine kinase MtrB